MALVNAVLVFRLPLISVPIAAWVLANGLRARLRHSGQMTGIQEPSPGPAAMLLPESSSHAAPCGEISRNVTDSAVLRLCGVPRGTTSMSPLCSVTLSCPSDSGASHSPGPLLCAPFGVPPSS